MILRVPSGFLPNSHLTVVSSLSLPPVSTFAIFFVLQFGDLISYSGFAPLRSKKVKMMASELLSDKLTNELGGTEPVLIQLLKVIRLQRLVDGQNFRFSLRLWR